MSIAKKIVVVAAKTRRRSRSSSRRDLPLLHLSLVVLVVYLVFAVEPLASLEPRLASHSQNDAFDRGSDGDHEEKDDDED